MATQKPPVKKRASRAISPVTGYARQVIAGKIIAGPHVRNQCKRHIADLKRADIYFDTAAAKRAMDFFPDLLKLSDGQFEGDPFTLAPAQQFIVGSIFGWKRKPVTGKKPKAQWHRRFRRAYIEMAKGNGKSPLLAGIGLYGMIADGEASAEIYSAAATKAQASVLFQDAVKMIAKSPHLQRILDTSGRNPVWQLTHLASASIFKPISKENKRTGSGPRPHYALVDELHEHPDRGIVEVLERGFKFRRQPLIAMATNSGVDPLSVCGEEHEHAVKVAAGEVKDDQTFTYVCASDKDDKPLEDERCWIKTNPLLGRIVEPEHLRGAIHNSKVFPARLNTILRLHFCEWTQSTSAWITRDEWESLEDPNMKESDFAGQPCWGGLDLSATTDLSAFVVLFADGENDKGQQKFAAFAKTWMPDNKIADRSDRDRAPYEVWAREGWLTLCPGARIRMEFIAQEVMRFCQDNEVRSIAYDRYLYNNFEDEVLREGGELPLIEHGQGTNRRPGNPLWMPESIDTIETLIFEKRLRVEPNPLFRLAVSGAALYETAAQLRRWVKNKSTARIDPLVALTMAAGVATMTGAETLADLYNKGEFEVTVL